MGRNAGGMVETRGRKTAQGEALEASELLLSPPRLRRVIQKLGPVFIKMGQFLATRPDLIPQEYCDELLNLADRVPPFPWSVARRIIREDLGAEPEDLFHWINSRPVAAASFAQVHLARLADGREVAVKVQREGIAKEVALGLERAGWLMRALEAAGILMLVSVKELRAELERWLVEELDVRQELANLTRMYEMCAPELPARIPKPYPRYCGARVITSEYLRGVPFSELLRRARRGGTVGMQDFDQQALSENLVLTVLTQIFEYGLFHGDVHPGNLIALPGNFVGFVDFGRVDTMNEGLRRRQEEYIAAVYNDDQDLVYRSVVQLLIPGKASDVDGFRSDFLDAARNWQRESAGESLRGGDTRRSTLARYMISVLQAARLRGFQLPTDALAMYRSLLTADTLAGQLGSRSALRRVGAGFFRRLRSREAFDSLMPDRAAATALDLLEFAQTAPRNFNRLLGDLVEERLVLKVRTAESPEDRRNGNLRARLIALALASVSLTILLLGYHNSPLLSRAPLEIPLVLLLLAAYVRIVLLWRKLR